MTKIKLVPVKQKINGTISAAINRYISMGVPLKQLLSDYNDILTSTELLRSAVNPWESINLKKGVDSLLRKYDKNGSIESKASCNL